jgi:hypothetical protein
MLSDFLFHHIGFAVNSIITTSKYYLESGYAISNIVYDQIQNVSIVFLEKY